MKKLTSLVLAAVLLFSITAALADDFTSIDGLTPRNIKIHSAGLNPSADEMWEEGISPTTGRKLLDVQMEIANDETKKDYVGFAMTGYYQPVMIQVSNANNGVGKSKNGKYYISAPVNGTYADIVYEAPQKRSGSETRMSMIFSDVVPDYVGFVRSTRLTHCRLRQEWECAFCTSGYATADVPAEWKKLGVQSPTGKRTFADPGIVYVGDFPKEPWVSFVHRLSGIESANNELFEAAKIVEYTVPKDHVPANHTWIFTDDVPAGGDDATIVEVTFGNWENSDSRLEYDEETNAYYRYVEVEKNNFKEYMDVTLVNPELKKVKNSKGKQVVRIVAEDRPVKNPFAFNNVIVQSIKINWKGGLRPDPVMVGTGNADYFMCGKHYTGVWERKDINSRTVFYDKDGYEIEMQRGKTLIILLDYSEKHSKGKGIAGVKYQ